MREFEIEEKRRQIQLELEQWALSRDLRPGQQLQFSLKLVAVPIVARIPEENYWTMAPEEFFSKKRMLELGVPSLFAGKIATRIGQANKKGRFDTLFPTMRDFLKTFNNRSQFLKIGHLGEKAVEQIAKVLREANLAHI